MIETRGGVLFDDAIRERVAPHQFETWKAARVVSDVAYFGSMLYRFTESSVVAGLIYDDPVLSVQWSMIDLEALATSAVVLWGTQLVIGRERPILRRCAEPEFRDGLKECEPDHHDRNRSFIAGHALIGTAMASLTCLHHSQVRLYGGAGDTMACGLTVGAAAINSATRVVTEMHYTSDVVLGVGLGFFSGFVVPWALHYSREERRPRARATRGDVTKGMRLGLLPMVDAHTWGLLLIGAH